MKVLRHPVVFCVFFNFMAMASPALATDSAAANAATFGFMTLLPPLIAIALAFITKNVVVSLFIGAYTGTFMLQLNGWNIVSALLDGYTRFVQQVLASLADPWNAGIVLQCLCIGGLIALVTKMGGTRAIAEALARRATTPRRAQLVTWLMGLLIFFDDYANALTVGPIMRPVTDKLRISREKLAFIIDATAAPIAGIALISTWVAYEIGLIQDGYSAIGLDINAYGIFVETIPYRFYNLLILVFIVCSTVMLREFGPMYHAEQRARTTGKLQADGATPMATHDHNRLEPDHDTVLNIWNAILPIGVLIGGALLGFYFDGYHAISSASDQPLITLLQQAPLSFAAIRECFGASDASVVLFQAAISASIVAIVMGTSQRLFNLSQAVHYWIEGVKSLVITGAILLLAWSLSGVIKDLGTAHYLVSILSDAIPPFLLPSIIFVLGSFISFATGTSYGTMGILMPLAIPLAFAITPEHGYLLMNVGAVLTGAIFGDHCSPISDTTILSSMGASCDHIDHTKTQLVYALSVGSITVLFGYIPVGLGAPLVLVLPCAIAIIVALVFVVGKRVDDSPSLE